MAIYAISDLHLPLGVDKPMDVFGKSWENYVYRLEENCRKQIRDTDCVVLPGDFCWAINLEEAKKDFDFLNSLPGIKVLLKGNHDYWWDTLAKVENFMQANQYTNIHLIQNNSFCFDGYVICGTRFWQSPAFENLSAQDIKIYQRELGRVELSLKSARDANAKEILFFSHYPPISGGIVDENFAQLMKNYCVQDVYYGHLHSVSANFERNQRVDGICYHLISCNCIGFNPILVRNDE